MHGQGKNSQEYTSEEFMENILSDGRTIPGLEGWQWLRVLSILAEGLGFAFPNPHWAAHCHLKLHSGVPMTSSSLCRHLHAHRLTYTHRNGNKIFTAVDGRSSLVPRF